MSLFSYNKGYQENRDRQETLPSFWQTGEFQMRMFREEEGESEAAGAEAGYPALDKGTTRAF